jgi:hypothetical protein
MSVEMEITHQSIDTPILPDNTMPMEKTISQKNIKDRDEGGFENKIYTVVPNVPEVLKPESDDESSDGSGSWNQHSSMKLVR